ncbi:c-type cytochrome [Ottowia sp.]|uniref:c-type cytochrome n=1 Tax=Ottowia sp. TaxID=1898956 RepID=UPI002C41F519|nr:c-type cytochrome [Ottowia sp.]HOB66094.1 c-type cytochrome [Ottowia sp.]HPZ57806.1 c-type cytochrome [Ottowia sp.]HQD48037.1 c-type cytochrome [Ottowia sp.]
MSDITHDEAHTGPIKTPKQLFWVSVAAFVIPVFIIIGLVYYVTSSTRPSAGATDQERAIAERLLKVGKVEIRDANRPLAGGEDVYKAQCAACHASGVSGAPKLGNAGDWGPRLGKGYDTLVTHALKGFNAMAPQGGGNFSDVEIGRAVVYMANAAGGKFAEPAAPAGAASGAAPAAAAAAAPAAAPTASAAAAPAAAAVVAAAPTAAAHADAGKAVYDKSCTTCHAAGVAGAPKFGDKAAWAPRIATGMDTLLKVAIAGKGAMPPRGASAATDDELKSAIQYMVDAAK